jgi:DNA-binding PadR family transcriptional regulator
MLTFDDENENPHIEGMRKPRFGRVKPTTAFYATDKVYQLLDLLYQFRALRTSHIQMLTGREPSSLAWSLKNLMNHGYIDKAEKIKEERNLYRCDVYEITPKGLKLLEHRDLPYRYVLKSGELGMAFYTEFNHSMMVVDLLANLKAGADRHGIRMISCEEIAEHLEDKRPFEFSATYAYETSEIRKKQSVQVKPDGFFGFEYPDKRRAYFAIEAEHKNPNNPDTDHRATTRASTKKKFLVYRDIKATGSYKKLGISNMRVLIVAPTPTKIKNKFAVGEAIVDESHLFLGHWLPVGGNPKPLPELIDAPWLRIGLEPESLNGTVERPGP